MTPYYETDNGKLYNGDCLELMQNMEYTAVVTDPVWPNTKAEMPGKNDPYGLFNKAMIICTKRAARVLIHLGCDSDPRILYSIPPEMPFARAVWLRYARPHYKGRVLYGADIGYFFGKWPQGHSGVFPGEKCAENTKGKESDHPCPRKIEHVEWLIKWYTDETDIVIDPFCGSGTTIIACEILNRRWIAIDISRKYCDMTIKRIEKEAAQGKLALT